MKYWSISLLLVLAGACSVPCVNADSASAVIFLYRVPVLTKSSQAIVTINNKTESSLDAGQALQLIHAAGRIDISVKFVNKSKTDQMNWTIESGRYYYVQLKTSIGGVIWLEKVPEQIGRIEISKCRLVTIISDDIEEKTSKSLPQQSEIRDLKELPQDTSPEKGVGKTEKEESLSILPSNVYATSVITILDFQVENMSKSDAKLIIDLLFHFLVKQEKARVIDRDKRDEILSIIEFSQNECADENCQLQIGKMLSADLIIVGSIGRVSNRYLINTKMLRVETGEAAATSSQIYLSLDELVDNCQQVIVDLARKL